MRRKMWSTVIDRVSSRTQAVVAWFPPTDMVNWIVPKGFAMLAIARPDLFERILGEIKDLESLLNEISPIHYVGMDSPPLLLIHGDADKTVPLQQSKIMKAKYEELGRTVKLVVQPGGGHSSWPGIMQQYPASILRRADLNRSGSCQSFRECWTPTKCWTHSAIRER